MLLLGLCVEDGFFEELLLESLLVLFGCFYEDVLGCCFKSFLGSFKVVF